MPTRSNQLFCVFISIENMNLVYQVSSLYSVRSNDREWTPWWLRPRQIASFNEFYSIKTLSIICSTITLILLIPNKSFRNYSFARFDRQIDLEPIDYPFHSNLDINQEVSHPYSQSIDKNKTIFRFFRTKFNLTTELIIWSRSRFLSGWNRLAKHAARKYAEIKSIEFFSIE